MNYGMGPNRPIRLPSKRTAWLQRAPAAVEQEKMIPEEIDGFLRTEDNYDILLESSE